MGGLCNKISCNTETEFVIDEFKDARLTIYKSSQDKYYRTFDKKFNLLKYIQLSEYSMMLNEFNFSHKLKNPSEVLNKNQIFSEDLENTEFINFFKVKVVNHHLVYNFKDSEFTDQIFLEYLKKLFDTINKGMVSYSRISNKKSGNTKTEKKQKKYFLIALGMLYCQSDNWTKINFLFDIFCNENNKLEPSNNLQTFVFVLFLIASFAGIICIQELSKTHTDQIKPLSQEDFIHILEIYDVMDITQIKDKFCKDFFGESGMLTRLEYREKIINNGFDWIFSGPGIRFMLEKEKSNL